MHRTATIESRHPGDMSALGNTCVNLDQAVGGDSESRISSAAQPIPVSVFDTAGMPLDQAFSAWQDSVGVFYGVRLLNNSAERFRSRVEAIQLSETILADYTCVSQTFDRSRSRIARDGLEHLSLQFCTAGSYGRRGGGTSEKAGPGDLIIAALMESHGPS